MSTDRILMRRDIWVLRALFIAVGIGTLALGPSFSNQGPFDVLFRWIVATVFACIGLLFPSTIVSVSDDALIVREISLFARRKYRFALRAPMPSLVVSRDEDPEGTEYALRLTTPDGRRVILASAISESAVIDKKQLIAQLWLRQTETPPANS